MEIFNNSVKFSRDQLLNCSVCFRNIKVKFSNTFVLEGVELSFDSEVDLEIEDCEFKSDCTIGSNLRNCSFNTNRELLVRSTQSEFFKFNNIEIKSISYSILIKDSHSFVQFIGDGRTKINGLNGIVCGCTSSIVKIINNGTIQIEGIVGFNAQSSSTVIIENDQNLSFVLGAFGIGSVLSGTFVLKSEKNRLKIFATNEGMIDCVDQSLNDLKINGFKEIQI